MTIADKDLETKNGIPLETLGYDAFFDAERAALACAKESIARVVAVHRGAFVVQNATGIFRAVRSGKSMRDKENIEQLPTLGDWVTLERQAGDDRAVIGSVLPRKTVLLRTHSDRSRLHDRKMRQLIAANIDTAFIVESVDRDFSIPRYERFVALVRSGNVEPVLVLNKIDLIDRELSEERSAMLRSAFPDITVIETSMSTGIGMERLRALVTPGRTYCFLGSSGVGKSSLVNAISGRILATTGEISTASGRGRHTTTARHLYVLAQGGILIDNPGIREVGLIDEDTAEDANDIEMTTAACRFRNCTHTHEPGCKVRDQVTVDADTAKEEEKRERQQEFEAMSDLERRNKDRAFGKMIKRVLDERKETPW